MRKKYEANNYHRPATRRYDERMRANAARDIQRLEERFSKKMQEHADDPNLALYLQNAQEYMTAREREQKRCYQFLAAGVLGTIPLLVSTVESQETRLSLGVLWAVVFLVFAFRYLSLQYSNERELTAILDDFTRMGFSPTTSPLIDTPLFWKGVESPKMIVDSLLKTAQQEGLLNSRVSVSLEALMDRDDEEERSESVAAMYDDGELAKLRR